MKIGDSVVQIVSRPIEGTIVDTEYDKDTHQLRHLVSWSDGDEAASQRWFFESELKEVSA